MEIRKATVEDVPTLVSLSMANYAVVEQGFASVNPTYALNRITNMVRDNRCLVGIVEERRCVLSYFLAQEAMANLHSPDKSLSITYYHTTQSGIRAVKSMLEAVRYIKGYATSRRFKYIFTNSYLDNWQSYYKVLAKAGFVQRGAVMFYTVPPSTENSQRRGHT